MSSPESIDSGKFTGGPKSNFTQTCTLLSKYLKEKGSFGDLSLGLSTTFQGHAATNKKIEKTGQQSSVGHEEAEKTPLTIFYGGKVVVFSDFPAEKAKEIMDMAMATRPGTCMPQNSGESAANFAAASNTALPCAGKALKSTTVPLVTDLPLTRRASLARFFEKRKDRLTAKAPYQTENSTSGGGSEEKTWLGLAAQSPLQTGEGQL